MARLAALDPGLAARDHQGQHGYSDVSALGSFPRANLFGAPRETICLEEGRGDLFRFPPIGFVPGFHPIAHFQYWPRQLGAEVSSRTEQ